MSHEREFKPCVYCNTVTNHSFQFSHLEILLNVQMGSLMCRLIRVFTVCIRQNVLFHATQYIFMHAGVERRLKQVCTAETLKQH